MLIPLIRVFVTISIIAPLSEMFIIYSCQVFIIFIDYNSYFNFSSPCALKTNA